MIGDFECSNELFNRIYELVDWAVRSNLQHVLTDCPHREKLGWVEVSYLMWPSIAYRYRIPSLYSKVARDIRGAQLGNGMVPCIAPEYTVFSGGFRYSPEWASACIIDPWYMYRWYGDRRTLERHYPAMQRYLQYVKETSDDLLAKPGLGDWYDYLPGQRMGPSKLTSTKLTATATFYYDAKIMARVARLLGKSDDAERYRKLAQLIRRRFNEAFYNPEQKFYDRGSQTAQAMPLVLDMVPEDDRAAVLEHLVEDIRKRGNQQTAGDVGHRYLLQSLAKAGRSDVVFDMTDRTEVGSYGGIIEQGWTCMPEAWNANPGASMNHCMLGHIQEWFQQSLGGIQLDPAAPAFKRIVLRPAVVGDLQWVKTHHDSMYGRIGSRWKMEEGRWVWTVEVPPNTTAEVHLPARSREAVTEKGRAVPESPGVAFEGKDSGRLVYKVGSGTYRFAVQRPLSR